MHYRLTDRVGIARAVAKRLGIDSEAFASLALRVYHGERVMFPSDMPEAERIRLSKLLAGAASLESVLCRLSLHGTTVQDSHLNHVATAVGRAIRNCYADEAKRKASR